MAFALFATRALRPRSALGSCGTLPGSYTNPRDVIAGEPLAGGHQGASLPLGRNTAGCLQQ